MRQLFGILVLIIIPLFWGYMNLTGVRIQLSSLLVEWYRQFKSEKSWKIFN